MCEIAYTLYPCGDSLSHYCTDTYSTRPSLNCKQCKKDERTQVEFTRGRRITAPYERYVWIWICMKKTTIQRSYVRNSFRWHLNPFSTTSRCNYVYSVSVCVSVFCFGIWGIIYVAPRLVESEKLPVKQIMSIYVVWYTEAQWSSTPVFGLFTALSLSLTHSLTLDPIHSLHWLIANVRLFITVDHIFLCHFCHVAVVIWMFPFSL